MNYRRHGLKALGLSILAALGLMTFMVAGAQAGGGEWLVLDKDGTALTLKELNPQSASITLTQEGIGRVYILKLNVLQKCETVTTSNAHIVPLGHGKATITFSKCYYTDLKLVKSPSCGVKDYTINVLILLIKHNGAGYLLFSPLTGLTFAALLNTGEECTLPHEWEFKGHFVAKIEASPKQHLVTQLISTKGMLELFPTDTVTYGSHVTHFEFDGLVQLTGTHQGLSWGYHLL